MQSSRSPSLMQALDARQLGCMQVTGLIVRHCICQVLTALGAALAFELAVGQNGRACQAPWVACGPRVSRSATACARC